MTSDPLLVDCFEPIEIRNALKKLGIPVKIKKLEVGDYCWSSYIIERKSIQDLLSSIYKGRLYKQLYNLMKAEELGFSPLLFVIGDIPPETVWRRRKKGKTYQQTLTKKEQDTKEKIIISNLSLAFVSFHIPVYICRDRSQFVSYISTMYFRCNKKIKGLKPVKRKSTTIAEIKSDIFCSLPFVGRITGNKLSEKYTVKDFVNLTKKQLEEIERIGQKRAKLIYDIFNT
uniref:Putative nuclease n=1 Tax=viral metagenome TaxID=1070528 RepID=A0A6H1ZZS2_9ZZZZ